MELYPSARYHESLGTRLVNDKEEDAIAAAEGWETVPFPPVAATPVDLVTAKQRDELLATLLSAQTTIKALEEALSAVTAERDALKNRKTAKE